jgi:hypothetical protein
VNSPLKSAPKNRWKFFCLLVLLSPLAQAQESAAKAPVAVLPLAGEQQEMAKRFQTGIVDATAALGKYYSWAVDPSLFEFTGLEIPTDMPPQLDLIPGSRYALSGGVYRGIRAQEYYLQLWLWDMAGSTMIYTDDLVYTSMDEAMVSLPGLVEWLFSHIHELVIEIPRPPLKPDPFFTLGFKAGLSQRWYTDPDEISAGAQALVYEGGVWGSLRLNSLFALQGEVLFTEDTLVYRGLDPAGITTYVLANKKYTSYSLMFPLLARVNFRPGLFRLSPMAGLYAAAPLGKTRYHKGKEGTVDYSWSFSVPLGFIVGFEAARSYGPGSLLAGLRYSRDFGNLKIKDRSGTRYGRDMVTLYMGYEFGFMDRNKRKE